jgi:uncharacterized protein YlxW (UPF0749 family)
VNPFVSRINKQSWVMPVSGMCVILGFMISLARVTQNTRSSRKNFLSPDQQIRVNEASVDIDAFQRMSNEVSKLQADNTIFQNAIAKQGPQSKVLNDSLQELKVFAGLTRVVGPGVVVTLRDSQKGNAGVSLNLGLPSDAIIHDVDVLKVVNELIASGSEAVSVNDHRVAGNTSFRCVGTTILVNDIKIASPVVIRAIGDPSTLLGAMNMPGGVLAEIRQTDPTMVQIETVKSQQLPEFVGNTGHKFAKPLKVVR